MFHAMQLQGEHASRGAAQHRFAHRRQARVIQREAVILLPLVGTHAFGIGAGQHDAERGYGVTPGRVAKTGQQFRNSVESLALQ
jgi:hypothetical protein